ncbi:MAG: hypothetical protein QXM43_00230 [Desulfurococcaceae archaeon]
MLRPSLIALILAAFIALAVQGFAEERQQVLLLDLEGKQIPREIAERFYFNVSGNIFNLNTFISNFNISNLNRTTVLYNFLDKNWTINFLVKNLSSNTFALILSIYNLSTLNVLFYNVSSDAQIVEHISNLASVMEDEAFSNVSLKLQSIDESGQAFFILVQNKSIYVPLTSHEGKAYSWVLNLYYKDSLLSNLNLSSTIFSIQKIPVFVIGKTTNLSSYLGIDPACDVHVELECGGIIARGKSPSFVLESERNWVYPRSAECKMTYTSVYASKTCTDTLENLLSNKCLFELYALKLGIVHAGNLSRVKVLLNSKSLSAGNITVCLPRDVYNLAILYDYQGLNLLVYNRSILVDKNQILNVIFNFTNVWFELRSECPPVVYVNGFLMPVDKLSDHKYVLRNFPVSNANVTLVLCNSTLSFDPFSPGDVRIQVSLPKRETLRDEFDRINLQSISLALFFIILQFAIILIGLMKLRTVR